MAGSPRVSVLMSVFDGEAYLRPAIESVLAQTFANFELIVVDDGSTDGTAAILASVTDPRLRVLVNPTNLGLTVSLNRAFAEAQGELVARLDADDLALPERLAEQVAFLDAHPGIDLLGSAYHVIDAAGRITAIQRQPAEDALIRWQMLFHNAFCHSAVMVRRAAIRSGLLYDPGLAYAQDYEAWSRLLEHGRGANLTVPLVCYRLHDATLSTTRCAEQQQVADSISRRNLMRLMGEDLADSVPRLRAICSRGPFALERGHAGDDMALYLKILAAYLNSARPDDAVAAELWRRETRRFYRAVQAKNLPVWLRVKLGARAVRLGRAGWKAAAP